MNLPVIRFQEGVRSNPNTPQRRRPQEAPIYYHEQEALELDLSLTLDLLQTKTLVRRPHCTRKKSVRRQK